MGSIGKRDMVLRRGIRRAVVHPCRHIVGQAEDGVLRHGPDAAMSRMRVGAVPQYTVLCLPDNVTAWMHHCSPDTAAENHISFPDGAHANPSRDSHPLDRVFI